MVEAGYFAERIVKPPPVLIAPFVLGALGAFLVMLPFVLIWCRTFASRDKGITEA